MPFIRLSDNYIDHPKFLALTEGSFCLWHEGMAFARKHQTDGIIPFAALKTFRFFTKSREKQLATPHIDGANPLWVLIPRTGYRVHDYLEWNPSRDEENERRAEAKERMRSARERRHQTHGAPGSSINRSHVRSHEQSANNIPRTNTEVLDMDMERKVFREEKEVRPKRPTQVEPSQPPDPTDVETRAGWLLNRYAELFFEHQRGARYHRRDHLDFPKACNVVQTWPDNERLEKLATLVLTTDDDWISKTDRGFAVFAAKATWADQRLAAWEAEHGIAV